MFQKLQQSEPWACYIPLVLKVEPGQHTDMSPCKGHWGASGNGVRDGSPDPAVGFWDQFSEYRKLESWSVSSPCGPGELKGSGAAHWSQGKKNLVVQINLS